MDLILAESVSGWPTRGSGGEEGPLPGRSIHRSPYHPLLISGRIQRALIRYELTRADLARALGVTPSAVSQKFGQNENKWSVEDLAIIHDWMSEVSGRPLLGFPFLDENLVEKLDSWYLGEPEDGPGAGTKNKGRRP